MRWSEIGDSVCPIARALSVVGDRWTLLILREIRMGNHRFEEMQAQTGMSSHLLSMRLKRLQEADVLNWQVSDSTPARHEYSATKKGIELDALLRALQAWGQKWGGFEPGAEPALSWKLKQTQDGRPRPIPKSDGRSEDMIMVVSEEFARERKVRHNAFMRVRKQART